MLTSSAPIARSLHRPASGHHGRWLWLTLGAILSLSTLGRSALAQNQGNTTSLRLTQTQIQLASGEEYRRPVNRRPFWISYEDCIRDDAYVLPIDANSSDGNIEVWAGNEDCAANRPNPQNRGQCWLVLRQTSSVDPVDLEVPMRSVVARDLSADEPPTDLGPEVCSRGDSLTGEAITYFILRVNGGQVRDQAIWGGGNGRADTGIDVLGPNAPTGGIDVKIGENQLIVEVDETEDNDDLARFQAYCVPLSTPANQGVSDAGVAPDAGGMREGFAADAGDAGPSSSGLGTGSPGPSVPDAGSPSAPDAGANACISQVLTPGELPSLQARQHECGKLGRTSRRLRTTTLENNVTYAVAMAAEDDIGNAGALSNVECATPIELIDFFESYKEQGGPGGGGFCSLQQAPAPDGSKQRTSWAWLCLAALAVGLRRRSTALEASSNTTTQEQQ